MILGFVVVILMVLIGAFFILRMDVFGAAPSGERLERMEKSKFYKNGQFQNLSLTPALAEGYSMPKVMWGFLFGKKSANLVPKDSIPTVKTDLKKLSKQENVFIWLGHSSYYLQIDGANFLIDPVFSEHGSPFPFGNKAFLGTNIYQTEDFPNIDYLVITHDHFDHLDYPSIKKLRSKVSKVILPLGVGAHFEKWNYSNNQLIEEEWYTSVDLTENIKIHFTPARHFSGRKFKRNNTLWTSYVLETPSKTIYLGGDSGYDTHYKEIGEKFGPFDYAIVENGQYNPIWRYIHNLPEDVIKAGKDLNAKQIIPVHFGKFALAYHDWDEPIDQLYNNAKSNDLNILTPMIGEPILLNDSVFSFKTWWRKD